MAGFTDALAVVAALSVVDSAGEAVWRGRWRAYRTGHASAQGWELHPPVGLVLLSDAVPADLVIRQWSMPVARLVVAASCAALAARFGVPAAAAAVPPMLVACAVALGVAAVPTAVAVVVVPASGAAARAVAEGHRGPAGGCHLAARVAGGARAASQRYHGCVGGVVHVGAVELVAVRGLLARGGASHMARVRTGWALALLLLEA